MMIFNEQPGQPVQWRKSSHSGNANNCVEVASWRKSSHSGDANNCIEVASWRKSTHSGDASNCVEVAPFPTAVAVRDSKNPDGGALVFSPAAWSAFTTRLSTKRWPGSGQ